MRAAAEKRRVDLATQVASASASSASSVLQNDSMAVPEQTSNLLLEKLQQERLDAESRLRNIQDANCQADMQSFLLPSRHALPVSAEDMERYHRRQRAEDAANAAEFRFQSGFEGQENIGGGADEEGRGGDDDDALDDEAEREEALLVQQALEESLQMSKKDR